MSFCIQKRSTCSRFGWYFLNKAVQPGVEGFTEVLNALHQRQVAVTRRQRSGHKLFDNDGALQLMVAGAVENAKAAAAHHLLNLKLIEAVADRQCVRLRALVIMFRLSDGLRKLTVELTLKH